MSALETLDFWGKVLSMPAFTGKYGTACLYLNNYVHGWESFLYLKIYNTIVMSPSVNYIIYPQFVNC